MTNMNHLHLYGIEQAIASLWPRCGAHTDRKHNNIRNITQNVVQNMWGSTQEAKLRDTFLHDFCIFLSSSSNTLLPNLFLPISCDAAQVTQNTWFFHYICSPPSMCTYYSTFSFLLMSIPVFLLSKVPCQANIWFFKCKGSNFTFFFLVCLERFLDWVMDGVPQEVRHWDREEGWESIRRRQESHLDKESKNNRFVEGNLKKMMTFIDREKHVFSSPFHTVHVWESMGEHIDRDIPELCIDVKKKAKNNKARYNLH